MPTGSGPLAPDGAAASGSAAVEAALALLGVRFNVREGRTCSSEAARSRVGNADPMRQIPTRVLSDGEVMTECAAILVYPAALYRGAKPAPAPGGPARQWCS